jgi:hypothetical protein
LLRKRLTCTFISAPVLPFLVHFSAVDTMESNFRTRALFALLLSSASLSLAAHGYDRLVQQDLAAAKSLYPFSITQGADGTQWLVTEEAFGSNHALQHLNANGELIGSLRLSPSANSERPEALKLFPLADHGVLELDVQRRQIGRFCNLRRIAADGTQRFERKFNLYACSLQLREAKTAPFLIVDPNQLAWVGEDGALASIIRPEALEVDSIIQAEFAEPGLQASNAVVTLGTNPTRTGYVLQRISEVGVRQWRSNLPEINFAQSVRMRVLRDGRVLLLSSQSAGVQLKIYAGADGRLLETREISLPSALSSFGEFSSDDVGNLALSLFLKQPNTESVSALIFSAQGQLLRQVHLPESYSCRTPCPLLGLARGFAREFVTSTNGVLVIADTNPNSAVIQRDLGSDYLRSVSRGKNNTLLVPTRFETSKLRAFALDGTEIPAPRLSGNGDVLSYTAHIAANGDSYALLNSMQGLGTSRKLLLELVRFDATAAVRWRKTVVEDGATSLQVVSQGDDRVCVLAAISTGANVILKCYNSSGVEMFSTAYSNNNGVAPTVKMRVLSDGRLRLAFVASASELAIIDISAAYQATRTKLAISDASIKDIGLSGSIVLLTARTATAASEWVSLTANGTISFRRPIAPELAASGMSATILVNDEIILVMPLAQAFNAPPEALYLSANGALRWRSTLAANFEQTVVTKIAADANTVYFALENSAFTVGEAPLSNFPIRIQALAQGSGTARWQRDIGANWGQDVELLAPYAGNLAVAVSHPLGIQWQKLSVSDGTVSEERMLGCGAAQCFSLAVGLDRNGQLRTVNEAADAGLSRIALGTWMPTASGIALDQPGLAGAWYTPQISGQGFFFDYFPASKLLFAPWFSYAAFDSSGSVDIGLNSVANLRWYTLSGVVEPGATTARLEIRRNIAGQFASPPVTTSSVVGTAILRAENCNKATLQFEFNQGQDAAKFGVLPLDRLTGGASPCQLPGGVVAPGRDARAPRAGFDSRQSGAWYVPKTSGQGLMLTVQPPSPSSSGTFFGGWFTYDAGNADDLTSQHWLTLAGETRTDAPSGVVSVEIYRTVGARLAAGKTQNSIRVGRGNVRFLSCDRAVFSYQFEDNFVLGGFRTLAGEMPLERIAACSGP